MKKLQRLGIGLGLAFALVSGTGYAAEFTALKNAKATPMQAEEMASVQGRATYTYGVGGSLWQNQFTQLYLKYFSNVLSPKGENTFKNNYNEVNRLLGISTRWK